jgi:tetratricopeptide (TPR) repeat protein
MSGKAPRKDFSTDPKSIKVLVQFAGLAAALMALIQGSPGAATLLGIASVCLSIVFTRVKKAAPVATVPTLSPQPANPKSLYAYSKRTRAVALGMCMVMSVLAGFVIFKHRQVTYPFKENYDKAIADYDKVITLKPHYANGYLYRAFAKKGKGDKRGAIVDFKQASILSESPKDQSKAETILRGLSAK